MSNEPQSDPTGVRDAATEASSSGAPEAGVRPPGGDWSMFARAVRAKIRADLAREAEEARRLAEAVLPRLTEVIGAARADGVCGRVWLFGSYAWGQPTAPSDVDLLIDADTRAACDEVAWRVTRALGMDVDAWWLSTAPPELVQRARDEGRPL